MEGLALLARQQEVDVIAGHDAVRIPGEGDLPAIAPLVRWRQQGPLQPCRRLEIALERPTVVCREAFEANGDERILGQSRRRDRFVADCTRPPRAHIQGAEGRIDSLQEFDEARLTTGARQFDQAGSTREQLVPRLSFEGSHTRPPRSVRVSEPVSARLIDRDRRGDGIARGRFRHETSARSGPPWIRPSRRIRGLPLTYYINNEGYNNGGILTCQTP